jgi:hypothetical protein
LIQPEGFLAPRGGPANGSAPNWWATKRFDAGLHFVRKKDISIKNLRLSTDVDELVP